MELGSLFAPASSSYAKHLEPLLSPDIKTEFCFHSFLLLTPCSSHLFSVWDQSALTVFVLPKYAFWAEGDFSLSCYGDKWATLLIHPCSDACNQANWYQPFHLTPNKKASMYISQHVKVFLRSSYHGYICELVSAWFIAQGIVGNVSGLKVEGNGRDSIARRTLVSLNFVALLFFEWLLTEC